MGNDVNGEKDAKVALSSNLQTSIRTGRLLLYGEIVHAANNVLTPIGNYFARTYFPGPFEGAEGLRSHCRIDCYIREHRLSPAPETVAKQLLAALLEAGKVSEPIWVQSYWTRQAGGFAKGEVFDFD